MWALDGSPRYSVSGSFIGNDVELDLVRLASISGELVVELRIRGTYSRGRISGRVTGPGRDTQIVLFPWTPNVAGIPGTYVLATVNGVPATGGATPVHDTLQFQADGQLTRVRRTRGAMYETNAVYQRTGERVNIRYISPFFDFGIPAKDSLIARDGNLVRITPNASGALEETYRKVP